MTKTPTSRRRQHSAMSMPATCGSSGGSRCVFAALLLLASSSAVAVSADGGNGGAQEGGRTRKHKRGEHGAPPAEPEATLRSGWVDGDGQDYWDDPYFGANYNDGNEQHGGNNGGKYYWEDEQSVQQSEQQPLFDGTDYDQHGHGHQYDDGKYNSGGDDGHGNGLSSGNDGHNHGHYSQGHTNDGYEYDEGFDPDLPWWEQEGYGPDGKKTLSGVGAGQQNYGDNNQYGSGGHGHSNGWGSDNHYFGADNGNGGNRGYDEGFDPNLPWWEQEGFGPDGKKVGSGAPLGGNNYDGTSGHYGPSVSGHSQPYGGDNGASGDGYDEGFDSDLPWWEQEGFGPDGKKQGSTSNSGGNNFGGTTGHYGPSVNGPSQPYNYHYGSGHGYGDSNGPGYGANSGPYEEHTFGAQSAGRQSHGSGNYGEDDGGYDEGFDPSLPWWEQEGYGPDGKKQGSSQGGGDAGNYGGGSNGGGSYSDSYGSGGYGTSVLWWQQDDGYRPNGDQRDSATASSAQSSDQCHCRILLNFFFMFAMLSYQ